MAKAHKQPVSDGFDTLDDFSDEKWPVYSDYEVEISGDGKKKIVRVEDSEVKGYDLTDSKLQRKMFKQFLKVDSSKSALLWVRAFGGLYNRGNTDLNTMLAAAATLKWLKCLNEKANEPDREILLTKRLVAGSEGSVVGYFVPLKIDGIKNYRCPVSSLHGCPVIRHNPQHYALKDFENRESQLVYAAQDYICRCVNDLLQGIQPVRKFTLGQNNLVSAETSYSIKSPWQVLCMELLKEVNDRTPLRQCQNVQCLVTGKWRMGRKYCSDACRQQMDYITKDKFVAVQS